MKEIICYSALREEPHIKHTDWISELVRRTKTQARVALWTILTLVFTAGGTASALNINLTYDPDATFTGAGLTAADIVDMKAAMTYAASQFTSRYSDPIDVNIKVTAVSGTGTLGQSTTSLALVSNYAALRAAIVSDSTTPDDATALGAGGSLPAADPIGGAHAYLVSTAEAKALGLVANNLSNDGTFTFGGGFSYTYDPNNRAVAGKVDFIGVAMHEISEIMGRIGVMGQNLTGDPDYMLHDLHHYTGAGVRGLNNGAGRSFSINNGTTLLKAFNNAAANGGDLQDWASGTNDAFNAFSSDSVKNDLSAVDIRVMDAIGYDFGTEPLCTKFFEDFDGVIAPARPAGWVATNAQGPAPLWVTATTTPDTPPNYAVVDDPDVLSDKRLVTPGILISSASAQVSFRNFYSLEGNGANYYDGAVLEVSSPNINGGTFTDITNAAVGGNFVSGGYVGTISNCCGNPLAGRAAWGQGSNGYLTTVANLGPNVVGQNIKLRFRMASDSTQASMGWQIDSLAVTTTDCPLQSAVSRKVHGGAGTFNINLPLVALGGAVGVENRAGAAGQHQIVVTFSGPVTVGAVAVTTGTGSATFSVAGAVVTINLTGVTNAQRLGVTLSNVTVGAQTGNITIPMGVLGVILQVMAL
jgi:hypothetical protein